MTDSEKIAGLEQRLGRLQFATLALGAGLAVVVLGAAARDPIQDQITARRIAVVDDRGIERVVIGQDSEARTHGRSAALWIYDDTGAERGGFGTFENGQASFALDAPVGVGAATRDRLGLVVSKDGAASIQLNNNDTGVPVRMVTDSEGGGGLELIAFDHAERKAHIRRLTYAGDTVREVSLDAR